MADTTTRQSGRKRPVARLKKPPMGPTEISNEVIGSEEYMLFTKENIREILENYREELIKDIEETFREEAEKKAEEKYKRKMADKAVAKPEAPAGADQNLRLHLKRWVDKVTFPKFVDAISRMVIGQEALEDILFNIYLYLLSCADYRTISNNILMAAPSGCGKTETFRALKQYFSLEIPELPVVQIDVTGLTPSGYVGSSVGEIIDPLISLKSDGTALVFLDEFDKCLLPQFLGGKTELNHEVQNELLTLIEGRAIDKTSIHTGRTMFIGMGAFDVFRKNRTKKVSGGCSIGFTAVTLTENDCTDMHYSPITMSDLKEQGAIPELLGRFVNIFNYHKLSDEAIDKVIDKNVHAMSSGLQIPIVISSEMRSHLHDMANSEFGCRQIYNELHNSTCRLLKQHLYEGKQLREMMLYLTP